MTDDTMNPLGSFLLPDGFGPPSAMAMLHEARLVAEASRLALRSVSDLGVRRSRPYVGRSAARAADPVILVPGFMAGDGSLTLMARHLRSRGFRTYRSHIHANVGCTLEAAGQLESRLESIVMRRGTRVQIVGHSLGGLIARGVAVRRPDLVSGIVTMGSPLLAPAAHHVALSLGIGLLVRLSDAGVPGVMSADCVAGECARTSFEESRTPLAGDVAFTALWSRHDGIVDWRACIDPGATSVEVTTSHCGMAIDPRVMDVVSASLTEHAAVSTGAHLRIA